LAKTTSAGEIFWVDRSAKTGDNEDEKQDLWDKLEPSKANNDGG